MDFIVENQISAAARARLKILVVDDDVLNQRMMQVLLRMEGYEVDLASNGLEALDAVQRQRYDIVFMDLQMPVMDGLEASRRIREWENGDERTFVVALTAGYFPEDGQMLFEAGMDNFVSKPFELEHVKKLLRYSAVSRALRDSDDPTAGSTLLSDGPAS